MQAWAWNPDGIDWVAFLDWDYSMGNDWNHIAAMRALCDQMGWEGSLSCGMLPDHTVWVFVDYTTDTEG